jgi:hypothetical protein
MGLFLTVVEVGVVGTCLLSLSFIILGLFGLFRNLPAISTFVRRILGWFMVLTLRLYQPILTYLQPLVLQYVSLDLLQIPTRIAATTVLSLVLLLFIHFMTGWQISAFSIGLSILHGFSTGLVWDAIGKSDGLQIGEKLE